MTSKKSVKKTPKKAVKKASKKKAKKVSKSSAKTSKKTVKKSAKSTKKKHPLKGPRSRSSIPDDEKVSFKVGRPRTFDTEEELIKEIEAYFEVTALKKLTITGLALSIGFEGRQSIYDYEKDSKFSYIIKRAKSVIEHSYEIALKKGQISSIFALKNFGWRDKFEVDSNSVKEIVVREDLKELPPEVLDEMIEAQESIINKHKQGAGIGNDN